MPNDGDAYAFYLSMVKQQNTSLRACLIKYTITVKVDHFTIFSSFFIAPF